MSSEATHIQLKTFHKDGQSNSKEKLTDIPVEHIKNGGFREYEDGGKVVEGKSIITYLGHKYFIAMPLSELKRKLSEKLGLKFTL